MPLYRAYGLTIDSELELPLIPAAPGVADITIVYGEIQTPPPADIAVHGYYGLAEHVALYVWRGVGTFGVFDGARIVLGPQPDADRHAVVNLVCGSLLAIALYQRGMLVLHASVVEIAGHAVCFLADTGGGKSTTAAAFLRAGCNLVADDHAAITYDTNGAPVVWAAPPQMKLWADALREFGHDADMLQRVVGDRDKRILAVDTRTTLEALPLGGLYVLEWEEAGCAIREIAPNQALVELVRNSYIVKLIERMGQETGHFERCARLASKATVKRLARPRDLAGLDAIVAMVRRDVEREGGV